MFVILYCPTALRDKRYTSMARYSLFVMKVSLNTTQTNEQTLHAPQIHYAAE